MTRIITKVLWYKKQKMRDDATSFEYFFRMSEEMSHCYGRRNGWNENLFFVLDYRVKKYITLNFFTDGRLTHYIVNTRKEAAEEEFGLLRTGQTRWNREGSRCFKVIIQLLIQRYIRPICKKRKQDKPNNWETDVTQIVIF